MWIYAKTQSYFQTVNCVVRTYFVVYTYLSPGKKKQSKLATAYMKALKFLTLPFYVKLEKGIIKATKEIVIR